MKKMNKESDTANTRLTKSNVLTDLVTTDKNSSFNSRHLANSDCRENEFMKLKNEQCEYRIRIMTEKIDEV